LKNKLVILLLLLLLLINNNIIYQYIELADLSKQYTGFCYFIVGIHPDNIDRTNKKSHETWLEKVEELAKRPECLAIMTGLNLNREVGTHFPQEALFRSSCALANKLLLPLHIHCASDGSSLDKALEILEEEGWTNSESNRVLLHDSITACGGDADKVKKVIDTGITLAISASGITDPDDKIKESSISCVKLIPSRQAFGGTGVRSIGGRIGISSVSGRRRRFPRAFSQGRRRGHCARRPGLHDRAAACTAHRTSRRPRPAGSRPGTSTP